MTNTKVIRNTFIAVLITLVIAVSSAAFVSGVKAHAAERTGTAQTTVLRQLPEKTDKLNRFAKSYIFKASGKASGGCDWTYTTDYKNIRVKCKYNYSTHKYTFKIAGVSYGLNHLTLRYKTSDRKWASEKMTVFVDSRLNIMRSA